MQGLQNVAQKFITNTESDLAIKSCSFVTFHDWTVCAFAKFMLINKNNIRLLLKNFMHQKYKVNAASSFD